MGGIDWGDGRPGEDAVDLARLVGDGKRVLHVGCGTGVLAEALRRRECQVVGIEIDPEAAKVAASACEDILIGDVEEMDVSAEFDDRRFDVVVVGNVLAHLRSPEKTLSEFRSLLGDGGYLVCSVPNAAHANARLELLRGSMPPGTGAVRAFTREALASMLADAGYAAVQIQAPSLEDATSIEAEGVPDEVIAFVLRDPDALVRHFLAVALPVATAQAGAIPRLLRTLASERDSLLAEVHALRMETARARTDLDRAMSAQEDARLKLFEAREEVVRLEEETDRLRSERATQTAEQARRDRTIAEQERHMDELRARITDLEREHGLIQSVLNGIYASKMWRWSERYRAFIRTVRH